jgi:hypothetical protein
VGNVVNNNVGSVVVKDGPAFRDALRRALQAMRATIEVESAAAASAAEDYEKKD